MHSISNFKALYDTLLSKEFRSIHRSRSYPREYTLSNQQDGLKVSICEIFRCYAAPRMETVRYTFTSRCALKTGSWSVTDWQAPPNTPPPLRYYKNTVIPLQTGSQRACTEQSCVCLLERCAEIIAKSPFRLESLNVTAQRIVDMKQRQQWNICLFL